MSKNKVVKENGIWKRKTEDSLENKAYIEKTKDNVKKYEIINYYLKEQLKEKKAVEKSERWKRMRNTHSKMTVNI